MLTEAQDASPPAAALVGARRRRLPTLAACALLAGLCSAGPASAARRTAPPPPLNPAPHTPPYSYLKNQTGQLGTPGLLPGTEVLPAGDLYTGYAEFAIRVGAHHRGFPTSSRVLEGGRYPVVRHTLLDGSVGYTMTTFTAPVDGAPVDFVRVEMVNTALHPSTARVQSEVRFDGGKLVPRGSGVTRQYRFPRGITPTRPGLYTQPGVRTLDPSWVYAFDGTAVTRNGDVLYQAPTPPRGATLTQTVRPGTGAVVPGTTFGVSAYTVVIPPGGRSVLDFKLPVIPGPVADPSIGAMRAASFERMRRGVVAQWRRFFAGAMSVDLPERKASDTYYASLLNMALPRYRLADGQWVQTVNMLRYHSFYLRDAAIFANAFDLVGLHLPASQDLAFFGAWQQPDGLFISRPGQYDGFGEALWGFGTHYRLTGNRTFLRVVYPSVKRAMEWLHAARAADPLHLMPVGDPLDNELVAGHITGDNFFALDGVAEAVNMARAMHDSASVRAWTAEQSDFRRALLAQVRAAAARSGGWIPPALDVAGGQDWGNLWASYPEPVLSPTDPLVGATLTHVRRKFREGIATYADGRSLHDYLGFRVFQTDLLRGDQRRAVQGLYDELAHTTSTGAGFEAGVAPYGNRTVQDATSPHGWFAAEYVAFLRNLLVRESGRHDVLLGSALPPAWLRPGQRVSVRNAVTEHGGVSWSLRSTRGGATLSWSSRLDRGTHLRLVVPSAARGVSARGLSRDRKTILLGHRRGSVTISWRLVGPAPTLQSTVDRLMKQYRRAGSAALHRTAPSTNSG